MKKHIFTKILTWSVICVLSPLFSKTWVSIDPQGEEGSPPQIVPLVSNNTQTVVDITIPGMWRSQVLAFSANWNFRRFFSRHFSGLYGFIS
jgi:hypothetical protein